MFSFKQTSAEKFASAHLFEGYIATRHKSLILVRNLKPNKNVCLLTSEENRIQLLSKKLRCYNLPTRKIFLNQDVSLKAFLGFKKTTRISTNASVPLSTKHCSIARNKKQNCPSYFAMDSGISGLGLTRFETKGILVNEKRL